MDPNSQPAQTVTLQQAFQALQTIWSHKPWFKLSQWHEQHIDSMIVLDSYLKQEYAKLKTEVDPTPVAKDATESAPEATVSSI